MTLVGDWRGESVVGSPPGDVSRWRFLRRRTSGSFASSFASLPFLIAASRVAPIDKLSVALAVVMAFVFLGEKPTTGNVLAAILVTAGVLVAVFVR